MISIIMPCYNAQPYLRETLGSLRNQGEHEWELLVVDDQSTDGSAELVRTLCPEATLISGNHSGIGSALNLATPCARGDFFAWIDADDIWMPDKLDVQFRALRENPDWDGCFVGVEQFYHRPVEGREPPAVGGRNRGSLLIKRESFQRVGPFREDIKIGEFVDWCARAEELGLRLGVLPQKLYRRRIHDTNTMKSDVDKRDYLKILKARLDRQRSRDS
jgi:glycosyltransferase involved in cell wall biosynthesis